MFRNTLCIALFSTLFILNGCSGGSGGTSESNTEVSTEKNNVPTKDISVEEETINIQTIKKSNLKTINLLVLLDAEDANSFNGINETKVDHFISVTNAIYANSNIDVALNINKIHTYNFTKEQSSDVLYEVFDDKNISTLRDASKSDLVVIYRKYANDGSCGVAFVNKNLDKNIGFAHVSLECPSTSTAHEIGHTMGLTHSEQETSSEGLFNYARGYGVEGEFVTIMAYKSSYNAQNRVFNYSNPDIDCLGYECGVDDELNNGANAAKALTYAIDTVVAFR